MEALLIASEDETDEVWHRRHSMKVFDKAIPALVDAEANGIRPDLEHKLVRTALDFDICRPINPAVHLGWYDKEAQYYKVCFL